MPARSNDHRKWPDGRAGVIEHHCFFHGGAVVYSYPTDVPNPGCAVSCDWRVVQDRPRSTPCSLARNLGTT
jgi:hypothetical protein